jgi:choline dehydrogenase-like flavoprotein
MVHDFESPETPDPGHADVCIIGAGAVGILLATQISAAGGTVTLLEGGGLRHEPRSQEIYRSKVTGHAHTGIHTGRFRTFGGTTTEWGGQVLELDKEDFEPRAWVAGSGWPIRKSELTDYYERALVFQGLRRVERDNARVWASLGLQTIDPGHEFSMLYSRWVPERNFVTLHERALTATRRLSVYTHANVVGFELNEAKSAIVAVKVKSYGGRKARVTADKFVVCMGGIETTRMLLQEQQQGIAPWQTNGLLGKHYQDHIGLNGIRVTNVGPQPPWEYFGYVVSKGFRYHNKIQLKHDRQADMQTLNVASTIGPLLKENPGRDWTMNMLRRVVREKLKPSPADVLKMSVHVPGIAAHLLSQRYRGAAPEWKSMALAVHCEQEPLTSSTISLSDERDELGLRRTQLKWDITDLEIYSLRGYVKTAAASFERAGLAHVEIPPGFFEDDSVVRAMCGDSNHHIGGTRMSASASDGIVDTDLKLHGIANGYVCSASVFPSSGFSNPTHTVLALAMRLVDKLSSGLKPEPVRGVTIASSGAEAAEATRQVALPGSGKMVPQLGFGCAYLLGPGLDRVASRRLLDAAYDAGIRHFDVARLYGQGKSEGLLGEFLREHAEATVTTKFGIVPPTTPERVLEAVQRRGLLKGYKRKDKATFSAAEAKASLEHSLRELGRDHVELFLLHEAHADELVHDDLLEFLERERSAGKIGDFGIGGEYAEVSALYEKRRGYARVLQFEWSVFGPELAVEEAYRIHYRTFARPADALGKLFEREPERLRRWSEIVDAELEEPLVLSRLLLKASLDAWPNSLTLFSTRRDEHIFDNAQVAANGKLSAPAERLAQLIRDEQTGIGAALYKAR